MKLKWSREKIKKVKEIVEEYLVDNEIFSGEAMQYDAAQIEACCTLAPKLADLFEDDEYWEGLFD